MTSTTKGIRVARAVAAGGCVFVVTEAAAFLVAGHVAVALVLALIALVLAAMVCLQTVRIGRRDREIGRCRPAGRFRYGSLLVHELPALFWCLLAGRDSRRQLRTILAHRERRHLSITTDEVGIHIAVVTTAARIDPAVAQLHAMTDDLAERATTRTRQCIGCGDTDIRAGGRCAYCYRQWKRNRGEDAYRPNLRWDGRTTHPDTTVPATVDQYAAWLRGYIKQGGKPTHYYDYPFRNAGFRYASSAVTIDSDYEYGARSRMIIVARNVPTQRTRPTGSFGGWAHTKVYFMHGYRANDIVPVYSDPEFDRFR